MSEISKSNGINSETKENNSSELFLKFNQKIDLKLNDILKNDNFEKIENDKKIRLLQLFNFDIEQNSKKIQNFIGLSSCRYFMFKYNSNMKLIEEITRKYLIISLSIRLNKKLKNEIFCLIFCTNTKDCDIIKYNEAFIPIDRLNLNIRHEMKESIINFMRLYSGSKNPIYPNTFHSDQEINFKPFSITHDTNYLYVGNSEDGEIRRFTFDLKSLENINIACKTNSLAISEKYICVNDKNIGVHFYDKNNYKLMKLFKGSYGIISYMFSKLIIPSPKEAKIMCFADDETLKVEEIRTGTEFGKYIQKSCDGYMISDDRFLYCVSVSKNCILKFKID
jgi:hypothetical protein